MGHEYLLWLSLFAYAVHIFEETALDWQHWATKALGLENLIWRDFFVANGTVIVTGVCAAMIGWKLPSFALIIPALQIINAFGFHIFPTIFQKRFSPGVITAVLLFLPIASWCYYGAYQDGVLNMQNTLLSFVFGGLIMASPFIFLKLRPMISDENPKNEKKET